MTLTDASVWIDFLRGRDTAQVAMLRATLADGSALVGDLTMTEVLQGVQDDRAFEVARFAMGAARTVAISDERVALLAARNFRALRGLGVTVRGTIDTLIATRCIVDDHALLFTDRDYVPFVRHLGLRAAMAD